MQESIHWKFHFVSMKVFLSKTKLSSFSNILVMKLLLLFSLKERLFSLRIIFLLDLGGRSYFADSFLRIKAHPFFFNKTLVKHSFFKVTFAFVSLRAICSLLFSIHLKIHNLFLYTHFNILFFFFHLFFFFFEDLLH